MNAPLPLRAVAGCFALACFAVAVIAGLHADRSAESILTTAIAAIFVGQIVGAAAAAVIGRALTDAIARYAAAPAQRRGAEAVPSAQGEQP